MGQYDRVRRAISKKPKLSILICTVPGRVNPFFSNLIQDLEQQIGLLPVEVLYLGDNFSMSVGEKRNRLKDMAKGDYLCYVDDDDVISPVYVKTVLDGCSSGATVITFEGEEFVSGQLQHRFIFSKSNPRNWKERDKKLHHMVPNHLCAWKKPVAMRENFLSQNLREDHEWGERMLKHIETEYHIREKLYFYYFDKKTTLTRQ